jgi:hypothetical protein
LVISWFFFKKRKFIKAYLNGDKIGEVNSGWYGVDTSDTSALLFIGDRGDGRYFPGLIDEVRIYNRALTNQEIKAIYDATK